MAVALAAKARPTTRNSSIATTAAHLMERPVVFPITSCPLHHTCLPESDYGRYGILGDHSGLMLAARITLPHFSVSSDMNFPKSAGEPGSTVAPRFASRALILVSAMAALISLFDLSMLSAGVLMGTPMPNQLVAS